MSNEKAERNNDIYEQRRNGVPCKELSKKYGISVGRISSIYYSKAKEHRLCTSNDPLIIFSSTIGAKIRFLGYSTVVSGRVRNTLKENKISTKDEALAYLNCFYYGNRNSKYHYRAFGPVMAEALGKALEEM